jgi:hypothetical protein
MRTFTSATATEVAKTNGAQPVYILQVDFPSGTVYWSGEDLVSPVTAEGRILSWGELSLTAEPGQVGSIGDIRITVQDSDGFMRTQAAAQPGFQNVDATLYLWFRGTTWADDRIVLHSGVLTAPCEWDESSCTYSVSMKDRGHKHDKNIGTMMTAELFPEISCAACENELIPIVYGNPCNRVPCCVINRPGVAQLAAQLTSLPPSSTLTIDQGAAAANFAVGVPIDIIVGWPGRWELITGSFSSSDDTTFSITGRGSILAEGNISMYGSGGRLYVTVPAADLPDGGAAGRGGYPLLLQKDDSSWMAVMITHWWASGADIICCIKGDDMSVSIGNNYQILTRPNEIPVWPAGTQVTESGIYGTSVGGGTWTYICNAVPSEEVVRVEIRARVNVAGGDSHVKWAELNPAYYSVNLNDTQFNANLGRDPSDPGVTTVTLDFSPVSLGMDNETIYVTLRGTTDDGTEDGTALEDPADVIKDLMTNPYVGGLDSGLVNTTSFTAAASDITTKCSFAITDEKPKLMELCSDIAHQANCLLFWDEGKACLKYIGDPIDAGDSVYTITNANRQLMSLRLQEVDIKEYITELTGKFKRTCVDDDQRLIRSSTVNDNTSIDASSDDANAAATDFGLQRKEIDFWAYQFPSSVAKATENWLKWHLHTNRRISVGLFFDALKLQPGDTVLFDIEDGNGNTVLDTPARVTSVKTTLGSSRSGQMPRIDIECESQLFNYGVIVGVPSDDDCAGQNTSGGRARTKVLGLRAAGVSRKLHAVDHISPNYGTGLSGGVHEQDPSADQSDAPPFAVTPPAEGNPSASSS